MNFGIYIHVEEKGGEEECLKCGYKYHNMSKKRKLYTHVYIIVS